MGVSTGALVNEEVAGDHVDLRLGDQIQVFTQLESAFAPGKAVLTPVDREPQVEVRKLTLQPPDHLGRGIGAVGAEEGDPIGGDAALEEDDNPQTSTR